MAILTSDKVEFKLQLNKRDRESNYVTTSRNTHKVITTSVSLVGLTSVLKTPMAEVQNQFSTIVQ